MLSKIAAVLVTGTSRPIRALRVTNIYALVVVVLNDVMFTTPYVVLVVATQQLLSIL